MANKPRAPKQSLPQAFQISNVSLTRIFQFVDIAFVLRINKKPEFSSMLNDSLVATSSCDIVFVVTTKERDVLVHHSMDF